MLELLGRYADALDACEQGLARLEDADEGAERDACARRSSSNAGAINYRQTNNEEAIRWLEAAAEHAERAGDRGTLAHAYYLLDAAHSDFGQPDGLRYLELARPIYEELGDLRGLGVVLNNLGIHAYYEGRWDESLAALPREPGGEGARGRRHRRGHPGQQRGGDPLRPGPPRARRSRCSTRCCASRAPPG